MRAVLLGLLLVGWLDASAAAAPAVPLPRAHAHNDYEHARPLHDALAHGFTSVEADVWLKDGALLVAHDEIGLRPERTLEALYLDPLRELVRTHGGSVYATPVPFTLLIDIKSDGEATYRALDALLAGYGDVLTTFRGGLVEAGAVTAIVSGNRPRAMMQAQPLRHAAYDGRLADLGQGASAALVPLISDNWTKTFSWTGEGPMPSDERAELDGIVQRAHADGQKVRFWATPDAPGPARDAVWKALVGADVDHLNTDDLAGLQAFLAGG